jgi:predicted acylesterase/phospholipase RssA
MFAATRAHNRFSVRGRAGFALALLTALLVPIGSIEIAAPAQAQVSAQQKKRAPTKKPPAPAKPTIPPRTPFTLAEQDAAVVPGIPGGRFWADSPPAFEAALPRATGPWLSLSSGGADGAFGAGVLTGWSAAGQRPEFALVTGVSTGALMAPFVFAGTKYDDRLRDAYTTINATDIFELGGKGESFFDTWPLKELLAKRVTPELIADVAAEHRKGRRLFVMTTNLDAERPVAWNMGAIAEVGGEKAIQLFRDILLAAGSIPGAFPPVLIGVEAGGKAFQEMHGDGGMNNQFYVAPQASLSPVSSYRLPATELYVIINTRLAPEFQVTERSTLNIIGKGVSIIVKSLTGVMIDQAYSAAKRSTVAFKLATIDPKFNAPSRGAFDTDYMKALFALGYDQGKAGVAFRNEP